MKLILSRKGFDSTSGGVPSPILPDGRLISLPIPDQQSTICYGDIEHQGLALATLVTDLTHGKINGHSGAHLDPDLTAADLPRRRGWRPAFGQLGAAQGHLRNQGVSPGDLFIFFGLFRSVKWQAGHYRWVSGSQPRHVIWGWLQVGEILPVTEMLARERPWLAQHPHLQRVGEANNVIYLASQGLSLAPVPGDECAGLARLPGAGVFHQFSLQRQLTARQAGSPSLWALPRAFYPGRGKVPLSFHADPGRWQRKRQAVLLQSVARGQEFVLDTSQYPGVLPWIAGIMASH